MKRKKLLVIIFASPLILLLILYLNSSILSSNKKPSSYLNRTTRNLNVVRSRSLKNKATNDKKDIPRTYYIKVLNKWNNIPLQNTRIVIKLPHNKILKLKTDINGAFSLQKLQDILVQSPDSPKKFLPQFVKKETLKKEGIIKLNCVGGLNLKLNGAMSKSGNIFILKKNQFKKLAKIIIRSCYPTNQISSIKNKIENKDIILKKYFSKVDKQIILANIPAGSEFFIYIAHEELLRVNPYCKYFYGKGRRPGTYFASPIQICPVSDVFALKPGEVRSFDLFFGFTEGIKIYYGRFKKFKDFFLVMKRLRKAGIEAPANVWTAIYSTEKINKNGIIYLKSSPPGKYNFFAWGKKGNVILISYNNFILNNGELKEINLDDFIGPNELKIYFTFNKQRSLSFLLNINKIVWNNKLNKYITDNDLVSGTVNIGKEIIIKGLKTYNGWVEFMDDDKGVSKRINFDLRKKKEYKAF